jgi:hypothetical protein
MIGKYGKRNTGHSRNKQALLVASKVKTTTMRTEQEEVYQAALKIRQKGRIRYGLINGGILGFIVWILTNSMDLDTFSFGELFLSFQALLKLGLHVLMFILFYATFMWWLNERTIKKVEKKMEE